jgi:putative NADPH-quinone reductase
VALRLDTSLNPEHIDPAQGGERDRRSYALLDLTQSAARDDAASCSTVKRILIIDGHPDPDRRRFCHVLSESYGEGARETGNEVRTLTLAEMDVPILRTAQEFAAAPESPAVQQARDDLIWCRHLVLIFPLWLGGAPAMLRALLEQVARANFMTETTPSGMRQRLKGRSARLIVTMGMPALAYQLIFHEHGVRNIMQGVMGFGGLAPIRRTLFGAIEAVTVHERQARIEKIRQFGRDAR